MPHHEAMAIRTIQELVDDLDGSEGELTIAFAMEGKSYEIDLNAAHADEMREALKKYIDVARRTRMSSDGSRRVTSASAGPDIQAIRQWAQANGIAVNDRGRVAHSIIEQYKEAQRRPAPAAKPAAEKKSAKKAPAKAAAKAPAKRAPRKTAAAKAEQQQELEVVNA